MPVEKDSLRAHYKRKLHDINSQERLAQSEQISLRLFQFLKNHSGTWALFSPLNDEPDLISLCEQCGHLRWVFPKVLSKTEMSFYRVGCRDQMVASSWGINEPEGSAEDQVTTNDITGCLVPGIAFDDKGTRLGRGGGYYDRFLQNFKGLKLGVTFNQGLTSETLPRRSHDQQMNIVVSPKMWIDVNASEVTNGI